MIPGSTAATITTLTTTIHWFALPTVSVGVVLYVRCCNRWLPVFHFLLNVEVLTEIKRPIISMG